jgi:micrococcal nuclease
VSIATDAHSLPPTLIFVRRCALYLVFALTACAHHPVDLLHRAPPTLALEPPGFERAVVERVVDGDTVEVRITGREPGPAVGGARIGGVYRVRLIGIDTPESVDPRRPVECYGHEAADATAALLDDRAVVLVKDVEETDAFDRLLRYVYIGAEMANARLVVNGYASAFTYPPNVRHADLFVMLQRQARAAHRGLWSESTCGGVN